MSLAPSPVARARAAAADQTGLASSAHFGALPTSFELNRGQVDGRARFLARGASYTLYLTESAAIMATAAGSALRLRYLGASPRPPITGVDELPGTVNYFLGADRSRWHTDIPTYARVKYRGVYPGIDLVFHGAGDRATVPAGSPTDSLEYDWIVHPGAKVSRIRLGIEGAGSVCLDRRGNLVLGTGGSRLIQGLPLVYQLVGGEKRLVSARYTLLSPRKSTESSVHVGFAMGAYDHSRPLVIDPTLVYGTYLGGTDSDGGAGIALDDKGDAYITGDTLSPNFPTAHAEQRTLKSDESCRGDLANPGGNCVDAFVSKLSPDGSTLLYSTYLGGTLDDYGYAIAVDQAGNAYVTGGTISANFPVDNALQPSFNGGTDLGDAFITKLSPSGDRLLFSTYLGGPGDQDGQGIAVAGGDVYIAGRTNSPSFPLKNALQAQLEKHSCSYEFHDVGKVRCYAAFVSKLSGDGKTLEYSTYLGGNSTAFAWGIAVDAGEAVVAGQTTATNFPVTHAVQSRFGGGKCGVKGDYERCDDAFVSELATSGQSLVFSTYLGAKKDDIAHAVAVDSQGDVYLAGETGSHHFLVTDAIERQFQGEATMGFVTKLNAQGTRVLYSTYLGGSGIGGDVAYAVAADAAGDAYVAGSTTSPNFPLVHAFDAHLAGGGNTQNAFITKINPSGTALVYSSFLGGSDHDLAGSVAVDSSGNAYLTGFATSTNFPTARPLQRRLAGGTFDAIVAKIGA